MTIVLIGVAVGMFGEKRLRQLFQKEVDIGSRIFSSHFMGNNDEILDSQAKKQTFSPFSMPFLERKKNKVLYKLPYSF